MKTTQTLALTGLVGALIAGTLTVTPASAGGTNEKCAGVVKAGKNDCATRANSCAGHSTADRQADAWVYVPAGTCGKLAGGRVIP